MTTSLSTSNLHPGAGGAPAPVDTVALPGIPTAPPAVGAEAPNAAQARGVPAGLAGATGISPQSLLSKPEPDAGGSFYYLLDSARPTSPQVLPVLNLAPPGLDPALGFTLPSTTTAADPRGLQGRSAVPGQHLGSTAPVTPGIELGAQPFAPAVTPASAFAPPNEGHLRGVPAAVSGGAKTSPQPWVATPASGSGEALYYFLESAPASTPVAVQAPSGQSPGPLPAASRASGGSLYFLDEAWSQAKPPRGDGIESVGYRPGLAPAISSVPAQGKPSDK